MRITSKGQVTIPIDIREKLGLLPNTEVEFKLVGNDLYLVRAAQQPAKGKKVVERMKGKATVKMTTDEILALTRK
jgi:AbrB family looped-hinge helix DNA binding protein